MLKQEKYPKSKIISLFTGVTIALISIVLVCGFYLKELQDTMHSEANRYLSEISGHIAALVNYRVEVNLNNLEAVAEEIAELKDIHSDQMIDRLRGMAQRYEYARLGTADKMGMSKTTDYQYTDVHTFQFFKDAIAGVSTLSNVIISPIDGAEVMAYAVPIKKDGHIIGVLFATKPADKMGKLLNIDSFNGEGYSQIIDSQGNFIVSGDNINVPMKEGNFFQLPFSRKSQQYSDSLVQMRGNLKNGQSGQIEFCLQGNKKNLAGYIPLAMEGWHLLSVVPADVAMGTTSLFVWGTVMISCIIILMFLFLILVMFIQQKHSRLELEQIAFVDPVTGGSTRSRFEMDAIELVSGCPPKSYAIVAMDIDKFKLINDTFGSEVGNRVLRYILHVIQLNITDDELVSRITADNFCLLIKYTSHSEIIARMEKIVLEINRFNEESGKKYYLNIVAGVYVVDDPKLDMITIFDRANVAWKKNKQNDKTGLLSCIFYSDPERLRMVREKEIGDSMETALENREFEVFLQPKYELKGNTIAGAEALVRWRDPVRGLIPPMEFIPLFERNGFITRIDLFVFEEVCALLKRWIDAGITPIPISVNLSRVHLKDENFLKYFEYIHKKYQIPGNLIEIELTETLVFENMETLINVIEQIHDLGFICSLDDFGSGYSSLNMIKDVPVDVLKLDREFFIDKQKNSNRGQTVVEAVIGLANKLGMHTVSEGVETITQVDFLREAKCDMVQGFVFSKPVTESEFELLAFGGIVKEDSVPSAEQENEPDQTQPQMIS